MPHRKRKWIATVYYKSETLGGIDVDFGVDDLEVLHHLIVSGPGYLAVSHIEISRNPHYQDDLRSIEQIAGKNRDKETNGHD